MLILICINYRQYLIFYELFKIYIFPVLLCDVMQLGSKFHYSALVAPAPTIPRWSRVIEPEFDSNLKQ